MTSLFLFQAGACFEYIFSKKGGLDLITGLFSGLNHNQDHSHNLWQSAQQTIWIMQGNYSSQIFFLGFLRKHHPDPLLNGPGHKQPWTHGVYPGKRRGPAIGWVQNHRLEALHSYWLVTESKVLGSAFLLDSYRITS